ncbi:hypothetical protein P8452_12720 [Trifolium repens]|nr:hypothetical protein P8452_12720 [Trifolium repens]
MLGLSVVLEAQKNGINKNKETPKVINKIMMLNSINKQSPIVSLNSCSQHETHFHEQQTTFLEICFLCKKKLLPGTDIYMYKGDRAFCSVECRCKQIFMDEEESNNVQNDNCYFAAISSSEAAYHEKGRRNQNGGFAY